MSKLIVTETGKKKEKVFNLSTQALIGRVQESDIPLAGSGVSREHAKIIREDEQFYLFDLGSGNGTLLNGMVLKPHEKNLLKSSDRITIDKYHLRLWLTDELFEESLKEEEEVTDADILEVKLLKKVLDAVDQETVPSLEVLNGSAEGKRVFLTDDTPEMIIGRDPSCDFPINEQVISRRHAKIMKKWGGIALTDMESKNGCFVNNKRVTEEFLHDGDRIALGTIVFLFRNPKEVDLKSLSEELIRKRPLITPKSRTVDQGPGTRDQKQKETEEESIETDEKETKELLEDIPSLQPAAANRYPAPILHQKKFSSLEIGMIGLGIAVLAFALITLVNLILE
ncbi:MAG: FHA domain-containing protein [Deltaproteobacteria bacterium]|nr:FHA domain-containing protein [Deltaproteobacteria bacterium]